MNPAVNIPPAMESAAAARTFLDNLRSMRRRCWRVLVFGWKFFFGMLLCQSLLGSVLIVGWTYRLMQRFVYKRWWDRSELRAQGGSFREFLAGAEMTETHVHWPNWLVEQNFPQAARRRLPRALVRSLWLNARTGLQGIFNTWVVTLPGCMLMAFSWYDGWNNSFNKGYEQAAVGPVTGISGLFLFIFAMFYVPMAQARQAATGEWRSFYQFRLIWKLVLRRWPACLGLASLYALFSFPLLILRILPQYFPQIGKHPTDYLAALSNREIVDALNGYFFTAALVMFPAYVLLRLVAARIYATGLLGAVEQGVVTAEDLARNERMQLERLNLLRSQTAPRRHFLIRLVGTGMTWAFWGVAAVTMFVVWFSFGAQIYIAQFLNYLPGLGWLNQPLVQLPSFHFIPAALK